MAINSVFLFFLSSSRTDDNWRIRRLSVHGWPCGFYYIVCTLFRIVHDTDAATLRFFFLSCLHLYRVIFKYEYKVLGKSQRVWYRLIRYVELENCIEVFSRHLACTFYTLCMHFEIYLRKCKSIIWNTCCVTGYDSSFVVCYHWNDEIITSISYT